MSRSLPAVTALAVLAASTFIATAANADYVCKVQEYLPLRDCPKPYCHEQYRLDPYIALNVYETVGKWYHVKEKAHGWDGFVLSYYVCPGEYHEGDQQPAYDNSGSGDSTY